MTAAAVKPGRRLRRVVGRLLRINPFLRRMIWPSTDYSILTRDQALIAQQEDAGWLKGLTAKRQQSAYQRLLIDMHRGEVRIDLAAAVQAVRETALDAPSILEVGCGGGYYSEVFSTLLDRPLAYVGIDYSAAMVESARDAYPAERFEVGDACALQFEDDAFDIVFNSVSLMHILDFERAIAESRRVARSHCLYHSVPIFRERGTTYLRKYAYGAPVVEVIFNRDELLGHFERAGLELVQCWQSVDYDVHPVTPEHSTCETYLLRVRRPGG